MTQQGEKTPVIAPRNFTFYGGAMFPAWQGSALIGSLASRTLIRITFDGTGGATPAERWDVGHRIRDVTVAPDGAVWMIEDANPGALFRVTPKVARSHRRVRGDGAPRQNCGSATTTPLIGSCSPVCLDRIGEARGPSPFRSDLG